MIVRPMLITYNALPSGFYVAPFQNALTGPNSVEKFFDSYGMPTDFAPVERHAYSGPDYRHMDNPWGALYQFTKHLLGDGEKALVVLTDWVEQSSNGWGGSPLALVGSYCARRLLTFGTPEHIVDDFKAMGLLAHELGHVIGHGHDLTTKDNVMWHWWTWPESYPSASMVGQQPAPLSRLSLYVDSPCPKPA